MQAIAPTTIDAHQHFWHYSDEEFGWISDPMAAIRRDFLPADLRPLLDAAGIDATIAVQARQTISETEWLLKLAKGERVPPPTAWPRLSSGRPRPCAKSLGFSNTWRISILAPPSRSRVP